MMKEKEDLLKLIHQLKGSNLNMQQYISEELHKATNVISMLDINLDLLGNKGKETFNLEPTNVDLTFFLEEKHILFRVRIGHINLHEEKFSYNSLIINLNKYLNSNLSLREKVNKSLKPLLDNYIYIFHSINQIKHNKIMITDEEASKDIEDFIMEDSLDSKEYLLMNNDGFKYIDNLDIDYLKVINLDSPQYVTFIREGGGNLLNSPINLTYQSIAEMLKALALIDHQEFVKGLMFLDLGIFDEEQLDLKYHKFIENYSGTLINTR